MGGRREFDWPGGLGRQGYNGGGGLGIELRG